MTSRHNWFRVTKPDREIESWEYGFIELFKEADKQVDFKDIQHLKTRYRVKNAVMRALEVDLNFITWYAYPHLRYEGDE